MAAPLTLSYSVTGTCQNVNPGSVQIYASGGIEPYFYTWLDPLQFTSSFVTGLGSGVYNVLVNDSAAPVNNSIYLSVSVSSGICLSLVTSANTTCGDSNGFIVVSAKTDYTQINYFLIDNNNNNNIISSLENNQFIATFDNLSAGTYTVLAKSLAGCSAKTETIIINSGKTINFGFYTVNNTSCDLNSIGKIFITGLTGNGPFIYNWSNGFTGSSITGLTEGVYGCTVTSADNCVLTKTTSVGLEPSLGLGFWSALTTPTCFNNDGSLVLKITGGTGPYYYSASNSNIIISYDQTQTFTNLPEGIFTVNVTDATFCKQIFSTNIDNLNTINNVTFIVNDSFCSLTNGSIIIQIFGGTPPFTYTLSGVNSSEIVTTNSVEYSFNNLSSGDYNITVTNIGLCTYTKNFTVLTQNKFTHNINVIATTCGNNNGILTIDISSGGTPPYMYELSNGFATQTPQTIYSFSNLSSGPYFYSVTDVDGCRQQGSIFISASEMVNFELYSVPCLSGNNGSITVLISSGSPPFIFNWSNNVIDNPQQIYVTGLTADTYSLLIIDVNGCSYSATTVVDCFDIISTYQVYGMAQNNFSYISNSRRGMLEMLNQGYANLTSGLGGCLLSATTFTIQSQIQDTLISNLFFTGASLLQIPSDTQWYDAVYSLFSPYAKVLTINQQTTNLTIEIPNNPPNPVFTVNLLIDYVINCFSTPTPTNTPSFTPTKTTTITPTSSFGNLPTNTVTPSQTVSISNTITPTITPTITNTITQTITNTKTGTPTITNSQTPTLSLTCLGVTVNCYEYLLSNIGYASTTYQYKDCSNTTQIITILSNNYSVICAIPNTISRISGAVTPFPEIIDGGTTCGSVCLPITPTPTNTIGITPTPTKTLTNTPSNTLTNTQTPTNTYTPTETPTNTQTPTNTYTPSNTVTNTNTQTPTNTITPTTTSSITPTPTNTITNTVTTTVTKTSVTSYSYSNLGTGGGDIEACGESGNTFYGIRSSFANLQENDILYIDSNLTTPAVGFTYVSDSSIYYEVNGTTGSIVGIQAMCTLF